jgi:hypothetical protein
MTTNTDVILFRGQKMAGAFAALGDPNEDSLSAGIGASYGVIGYRGKNWTLRYRGETYPFVRADDGSPLPFIDVIILRSSSVRSKSYYPGPFNPNEVDAHKRPTCASIDGVRPDADVLQKQSDSCGLCPRNVFKTNPENGRRFRECSDYKRLAVLIMPSMTRVFFGGQPLLEPVFLRVPAASLNDLATFGDTLSGQGYHYCSYVTRVSFVPDQAHPQFSFKAVQLLTDAEAPVALPLRDDPVAIRITGEDQIGTNAPRIAAQPARQEVLPPPKQEVLPPSKMTAPGQADLGLAGLSVLPPQSNGGSRQPAILQQNAAATASDDTGGISESDADLDARIAALLPGK